MQPFHEVHLHTPRLILRPLRDADALALFEIHSNQAVARYLSRPAWTAIDAAHELIARDKDALPVGKYLRLGISLAHTPTLIGECSLHSLNEAARRAEVGYALAPGFWGQGYAVEAMAALITHACADLQLNRLEADIDPRNHASAKVLERLGFSLEGRLRERWIVEGQVSDSALYGLLQSEWRRQREHATPEREMVREVDRASAGARDAPAEEP